MPASASNCTYLTYDHDIVCTSLSDSLLISLPHSTATVLQQLLVAWWKWLLYNYICENMTWGWNVTKLTFPRIWSFLLTGAMLVLIITIIDDNDDDDDDYHCNVGPGMWCQACKVPPMVTCPNTQPTCIIDQYCNICAVCTVVECGSV